MTHSTAVVVIGGGRSGPAAATPIGVGRPARDAAREISALLGP
ncbi:hypothetical protein [Streptomyces sp. NBC_00158]